MRKRNLKLTLNLQPSKIYLRGVIGAHTMATISSVCLPLELYSHLLSICAIATSLCYQLNLHNLHSAVMQICLEAQSVQLKRQVNTGVLQDEFGELLPTVWILPGLCVLYFRMSGQKRILPIFADTVSKDDFRKLRVFALRGPLLALGDTGTKTL